MPAYQPAVVPGPAVGLVQELPVSQCASVPGYASVPVCQRYQRASVPMYHRTSVPVYQRASSVNSSQCGGVRASVLV